MFSSRRKKDDAPVKEPRAGGDGDDVESRRPSHLRPAAAAADAESANCLWCLGTVVGALVIYLTLNEIFELQDTVAVKKHMIEALSKHDEHFGDINNTTQLVDPNSFMAPPTPDFDMSIEDFLGLNRDFGNSYAPPPPRSPTRASLRGYNRKEKKWGVLARKQPGVNVAIPERMYPPPPPADDPLADGPRDWKPIDNQWRKKVVPKEAGYEGIDAPTGQKITALRQRHRGPPQGKEIMALATGTADRRKVGEGDIHHEPFAKLLAGRAGSCMLRSQPSPWQANWIISSVQSEATVRNALVTAQRQAGRCAFLSKNCVKPGQRFSIGIGKATRWASPVDVGNMPMLGGPRSLGSCAIVSPSHDILNGKRGWEIDRHKTIIRVGHFSSGEPVTPPVMGYELFVGARTDITFLAGNAGGIPDKRREDMGQDAKTGGLPRLYARQGWADPGCDRRTLCGSGPGQQAVANAGRSMYNQLNRQFRGAAKSPSSSFLAVIWFQASGLCESLDVYGMPGITSRHGHEIPAYFEGGPATDVEQAKVEQYAMSAAMRAGIACSYVDEPREIGHNPGAILGTAVDGKQEPVPKIE